MDDVNCLSVLVDKRMMWGSPTSHRLTAVTAEGGKPKEKSDFTGENSESRCGKHAERQRQPQDTAWHICGIPFDVP